jgi:RNA polymerase sigma factor (sigma-70 family)
MNATTAASHLSLRAQGDFALVTLAVEGSQKAYTELMHRYRGAVLTQMLKMVNTRAEADDLTMEAFGKAFRNLPNYEPRYAFSTWLFKIAINNAIDNIRKKRLRFHSLDSTISPGSDIELAALIRSTTRTPEEELVRSQQLNLLRTLIDKLSARYRLMIELRYFEDLSYDEIASELDVPLGTVKAQLFRAKELLYSMMQTPNAKAYFETTRRREEMVIPGASK